MCRISRKRMEGSVSLPINDKKKRSSVYHESIEETFPFSPTMNIGVKWV